MIESNKIFNPDGNDNAADRTIIKGNTTGLFNLNSTKYKWAKSLYKVMTGNFWIPEKVMGLREDANQLSKLSEAEQRAYKGIISFLTFLDSIQTVNIPNLAEYITAPEVNLVLSIQAYQEAIHSQSYATIIESVLNGTEKQSIYYLWKDDEILLKRNKYIGDIYQAFLDNPTDENFFRAMIANYLLEGLYFYNGFSFFDTLASQGKMSATGRMIAYIRRDELTHVELFANILNAIREEFPEMWDEDTIKNLCQEAVEQEIVWSKHILGNQIPGINEETIEAYTKWLMNKRLASINMEPLYPEVTKNPYKHLEHMQDADSDKSNFFETTVINYTQSSGLKGNWDF